MDILIILRDRPLWRRGVAQLRAHPGARIVVAPLTRDESLLQDAVEELTAIGFPSVEVLQSQESYRQVCSRAREKLLAFTAEWPDRAQISGRSFRQLFVQGGDLSWWWLSELSQRNGDDRPTFSLLCELELLKGLLGTRRFQTVLICVAEVDFYDVVANCARARAEHVLPNRPRRPLMDEHRYLRLAIGRWRDLLGELLHQLIVRWCFRGRPAKQEPSGCRVYWHSWYPLEWVESDGRRLDRYYLDLPHAMEAAGRCKSVYLLTIRGALSPRAVVRAIRRIKMELRPDQFEMVQRFGRVRDFLSMYFDPRGPLRYLWIENFSQAFRKSFVVDGVDLFPILRNDLRISFLRWTPRWLSTAIQFRRFASAMRPDVFVTYLELYCYGRAVIYGVKRGARSTKIVGYQHSAITPMKLVYNYSGGELRYVSGGGDFVRYMPLPDWFVLHGTQAERILHEGGYPPTRTRVTGALRLDHLYRRLHEPPQPLPGMAAHRKVLLVAPPIWPDRTRKLASIAVQAAKERPDLYTVFKLHPNNPQAEEEIHALARQHGLTDYKVCNVNLYRLLRLATVLFTTSSTSGAEAVAMGVPVIHLQSHLETDLSPFFAIPEAALEVPDLPTFGRALDAVLDQSEGLRTAQGCWNRFLRETFFEVDGKVTERFLVAAAEWLGADAGSEVPADVRQTLTVT